MERYLDWDLNHNTLVVMHQLILRQGGKGIAIGGYLSSWAAELWCLWKEHLAISDAGHKETIARWLEVLRLDPKKNRDLDLPATNPTLSLIHPIPFVPSSASELGVTYNGIVSNKKRHLLTPDIIEEEGFTKWWHPTDTLWGFFHIMGLHIVLLTPRNWDGGWEGRFGTILDTAPPRDRPTVRTFFERFEPLTPIRGEAVSGWQSWVDTTLVKPLGEDETCMGVLLTRYKDNTYIFLVNVPEHCLKVLRHCVFCLLKSIYGIPMKWEPEADPQNGGLHRSTLVTRAPP